VFYDRTIGSAASGLPLRSILLLGTAITTGIMTLGLMENIRPAMADSGTACDNPIPSHCQISRSAPSADHGQTGPTPGPDPITHDFTDQRTYGAGPGVGAIDFSTRAGNGGDANTNGQNGGAGGAGGSIGPVSIGSGVATQGANSNGILSFVSRGGDGGGGAGAHIGTIGRGGQGGTGGALSIDMNGSIAASDPSTPGLRAVSQGGTGGSGGSGTSGFYAAYAGNGGNAGPITINMGGSSITNGKGLTALAIGGTGGLGPNDSGGVNSSTGSDGGDGGAASSSVTITSSGGIQSYGDDGINIRSQGGDGGAGGTAGLSPTSNGGKGGAGGSSGTASVTVSGTVQAAATGLAVASSGGNGGAGGSLTGSPNSAYGGAGGAGGNAGTATATIAGSGKITGGRLGVLAQASGGNGGGGASAGGANPNGGNGGQGGAGGTAKVEITGAVASSSGIGVQSLAYGGTGGTGASVGGGSGPRAGNGGNGGTGGTASVMLNQGGSINTTAPDAPKTTTAVLPGLLVRSNGGVGGAGGNASTMGAGAQGGGSGFGGAGGSTSASINGTINTSGSFAHGVLAQSVGGAGNGGGSASSLFLARGGVATNGGRGGAVSLSGSGGIITTTGTGAVAMLGQSIGGGGGSGGNAGSLGVGVAVAIGGNGGAGGDGDAVKVGLVSGDNSTASLSDTLITRGPEAAAILAQSVGGAGGNGGNATAVNLGTLSLTIGGDGKGGGTGGQVNVANGSLITTFGAQSGGIAAQSVGGGGGSGGAAVSFSVGGGLATSVAVGGTGAGGGAGGIVNLTSNQQITTYGADSYALKAQSIGGGGGEGGTASSTALALSPDPEVPAIAVAVAVGGSGGAGGDQSNSPVRLTNNGLITTSGDGAMAMMAQNIAGGGGNGGDSSAWSFAGGAGEVNISAAVAVGGSGGSGGKGGAVTAANNALVLTTGESAYGMLGQSIGGGGGHGSAGDASAGAGEGEKFSMGGSVTVGGRGGAGSQGGRAQLSNNNHGGILTEGDGSNAMLGQSIGGGGGAAGGGVGKANGGKLSFSVTVGGNGGSGGHGGEVDVSNHYGLRTTGADADAMMAQSIGGGGGKGGKGASTAGGAEEPADAAKELLDRLHAGLGLNQNITTIGKDVVKVGNGVLSEFTSQADLAKIEQSSDDGLGTIADDDDDGEATSLNIAIGIGGKGGAGGNGGTAWAYNEGSIVTTGAKSDGIFVQSVGGGGGAGGGSSASNSDDSSMQLTIGAAGSGGGGGTGGAASIVNDAQGLITTSGVASNALVAQSIGGGGGKGGATASKSGGLQSFTLALGGNGGASGAGGSASVTYDRSGIIRTSGKNAIGIVAQSIGGGGGIAHVLSKDQTGKGGSASSTTPDDYGLTLSFGGSGGSQGDGGVVTVTTQVTPSIAELGDITTTGRNAYGILAQSIGGGGGLAAGGQVKNTSLFGYGGSGGAGGNGGQVTISTQGILSTKGDGATGIWAQSIGGGGGIGGDTAQSSTPLAFTGSTGQSGNGGAVNVGLSSANVSTAGANATAIFAQSIGGGGGKATTANGAYTGTAGGKGNGGPIDIEIGTDSASSTNNVTVSGKGSAAIHGQSAGQSKGQVTINIGKNSTVTGSADTPAILVEGSDQSLVTVTGHLVGSAGGAIRTLNNTSAGYTVAGWSYGNVEVGSGTVTITGSGTLFTADHVNAGQVNNPGTLWIGTSNSVLQTSTINAPLNSTASIVADVDFVNQKSDQLVINGNASASGQLYVTPSSLMANKTVQVLQASSLTTSGLSVRDWGNYLFSYTGQQQGNSYTVTSSGADFTPAGVTLSGAEQQVAQHLQSAWNADDPSGMSESFAQLSPIGNSGDYTKALDSLSGQVGNTLGVSRHTVSHNFVTVMNSCPTFEGEDSFLRERNCGWGRVIGGSADLKSSGSAAGFEQDSVVLQVGGQKEVADGWFLGGSIAYENSSLDGKENTGSVHGDAVLAGLLVKRQQGNWLISGALDAGYGWYDSKRPVSLGGVTQTATASPEAQQVGLHSRIAYQVPMESWYLKPYLDLHATYTRTDSYTESGAGALGLEVDSEDDLKFAASPMLEVGGKVVLGESMYLRPFASVGAVFHDDNSWGADSRFVGSPDGAGTFQAETELPDTLAKLNLGVELQATEHTQIKLEYTGELGDDYQGHAGTIRFNYLF
jgi:uncharacterized protein YhjY with autotransporter beta-barrel domain